MLESYETVYMTYKVLERDANFSIFEGTNHLAIIKDLAEVNSGEVLVMGGDVLRSDVRDRLIAQEPTIYIHRGPLGNHLYKTRKWWRYSVNDTVNLKLMNVPYSRWGLLDLPRHPWKVKTVKNVLIAPSKMTASVWNPTESHEWVKSVIDQLPGAEIKIRAKASTPWLRWSTLWQDLDWADLVISQASAITTEALWYGKKVISLFPCSTWAAGAKSTLENWQDPSEPKERDLWHEHVAWSQFSNEEWQRGESWDLMNTYIRDIHSYRSGYNYFNFNK